MDFVLGGQYRTALRRVVGQLHALLLGHQIHHPHHLLQNRQHVHQLRLAHGAAVQLGQAQQVLCDPGQPLRLLADVRDELPGNGRVDVLGLQNGVRQKADGRQRRLELVGGVGDKPPPGALRGLETVRQTVELLGNLGDLVRTPDVRPVAVRPRPHLADGGQKKADLSRQYFGEKQAQHRHHQSDDGGEAQEIPLKARQQGGLLRVVLIDVHRADDLIAVQHRGGRPAAESPSAVGAGEGVVPQQGLDDLRVQPVLPDGSASLPRVVENPAHAVGHQHPGEAGLLHHRHGRRHVFLRQLVQAGERVHNNRHIALQRRLLGAEHQILRYHQRIGIQQQQHPGDDSDIAQAKPELDAAPDGRLIP